MRTNQQSTKVMAGVLVGVLSVVCSVAQEKPDFSGRWILVSPSPTVADMPKALSVRQSLVRTNIRGEQIKPLFADISVDRETHSGVESATYHIGVVGGVVPGLREDGSPNGPWGHHAVKWDGNALVFENGTHTGQTAETGVWAERREVWSVDPRGRLTIVLTTRSSSDARRTVTLLYRRP